MRPELLRIESQLAPMMPAMRKKRPWPIAGRQSSALEPVFGSV